MAAPITKLRIGLKPDTPEEHTRLLINVNSEAAQTALQIATDLRVRANPATAKIYYYNFDGSELLYTETIEPGGNGSWDGEPGRASTQQYEFIFNGWSTEPNQDAPTEGATDNIFSIRRLYAAYKKRSIAGFLTLKSPNSFTIAVSPNTPKYNGQIFYSTNLEDWEPIVKGKRIVAITDGEFYKIHFRGIGNTVVSGGTRFLNPEGSVSDLECEGNIATLLDYEKVIAGEEPTMAANAFGEMFSGGGWAALKRGPELPATTLAASCYAGMFHYCAGLTEPPELPATTLAASCYSNMFYGCTGLTRAPELPATRLTQRCYENMFVNCIGLTEAPELPATVLTIYCYAGMFLNCTGLTRAPELPAMRLAQNCYQQMFTGCTGLTRAPELPATTIPDSAYYIMFAECTGLTEPPALPATKVNGSGYRQMFTGCTGLKKAPELPATTLSGIYNYDHMFNGCTGLTEPPKLPATTLTRLCYTGMFEGCTGIRISEVQTEEFSIPYRIPTEGTGTSADQALAFMFENTGGTFTGTPAINTTYYLAPPASA